MDIININGYNYSYYKPISYEGCRQYEKQIKRVKEKIRASQNGCYKDKRTKKGKLYYEDYPDLLIFLEGLVEK
jgi:hypothetical protein